MHASGHAAKWRFIKNYEVNKVIFLLTNTEICGVQIFRTKGDGYSMIVFEGKS